MEATPTLSPNRRKRAQVVLFACAAASILANVIAYFAYAVLMPVDPDFGAGRTLRVHLGGQLWVYVSEREALLHHLVQTWIGVLGLICMAVGIVLYGRSSTSER